LGGAENIREQPGVRAVEIALDILECIAFADRDIGVTQIASKLGLAKGATFRHLKTLAQRGYVLQNATTLHYQIGLKAQLLAERGASRVNLLTASEGAMLDLRDTVGETVVLSVPDVMGARVVQTLPGKAMVEIGVRPGSVLPFEASAQGKVFLAFSRDDFRREIMSRNPKLAGYLATPKNAELLERDLARVRKNGWFESRGEFYSGINAIAAPVFDASSYCVGTMAVVGLQKFLPLGKSQQVAAKLLACAERVSRVLGCGPLTWRIPSPSRRR